MKKIVSPIPEFKKILKLIAKFEKTKYFSIFKCTLFGERWDVRLFLVRLILISILIMFDNGRIGRF
jgi:hypothetical protein